MRQPEQVELAKTLDRHGRVRADAPGKAETLDLLDQTAPVRRPAPRGMDGMHRAHLDGRWPHLQVLWQTPP